MAKAKLIINGEREITADSRVISIGRASDNSISLADGSNISRYHAEIERRGKEFWLVELGSSNGTTLNDDAVTSEKLLNDGDVILLGGTSEIRIEIEKDEPAVLQADAAAISPDAVSENSSDIKPPETEIAKDAEKTSKMPLMLGVMGALCGLAVIFVAAAFLLTWTAAEKQCEAVAVISNPDNGETISEEIDVEADVKNAECVGRAIFVLDGQEFASADSAPYKAALDPSQFGDLADGQTHSLKVVLEDTKGNKIVQQDEIFLAFETLATPTPTPEKTPDAKPTPKPAQNRQLSTVEVLETAKGLTNHFSVRPNYKYDPQFVQEVQKKTAEYAAEGYFARAQSYRDVINVAYVQEQNLDAPLGYLLAMSRSKFIPQKQGAEEGLWQMSPDFVAANALNGMCGTEILGDASQNCAAKASALYLKAIVLNVFEGDTIYSVAAFGMSPQEAAVWKSTLPADRADFWKIIKSPKQREEVVRFFAAGIVAENPQKFGLKNDRPLSEIYRNLVSN